MLHYKVNVSCCDNYRRLGNTRGKSRYSTSWATASATGAMDKRNSNYTNLVARGNANFILISFIIICISFISFEMSSVLLCTRKVIPLIIKQIIFIMSFLLLHPGAQSAYFVPFSLGPLPPLPSSSLSRSAHPESGDVPLDLLPDERHAAVGHGRHMQGGHGRGQPAGALLVALPQVAQVGGTL